MTTRRTLRALSVVLLAATVLGAGAAQAKPRPKPKKYVPTTSKFYLRASGCGTTQEEGRLDTKSGSDDSTGCGVIGGLPADEVVYTADGGMEPAYFRTGTKGVPVIMDAGRKITGQVATQSWFGTVGGAGKVTADITVSGTTTAGKTITLGSVTVSADASPTAEVTKLAWEVQTPASAGKQVFKSLVVAVATHGANVNMNAQHYDGDAFVVFPSFILK